MLLCSGSVHQPVTIHLWNVFLSTSSYCRFQMKSKGLEACLCNCYRCEFLGLLLNHKSLLSSATMKACSALQLWKLAQLCNYESLLSSATMKACSVLQPWKLAQLCDHERLLSSATMKACQFYGHSPPLCQNLPPSPWNLWTPWGVETRLVMPPSNLSCCQPLAPSWQCF